MKRSDEDRSSRKPLKDSDPVPPPPAEDPARPLRERGRGKREVPDRVEDDIPADRSANESESTSQGSE
jgi:hypothetical protein